MKLYRAFIHCSKCGKKFCGDPMSNAEDAEQLARMDHRRDKGHWPDETPAEISEYKEEQELPKEQEHRLVDKSPIPNLNGTKGRR